MKRLTKIKLVNWHIFENETIDVYQNVLFTGDNSSGKSTILDAVQYILTAGRPKFNTAANEKSQRTLDSYIRGKLGLEGKEYLREGDVVAHVALEFHNEDNDAYEVLGAAVEAGKNSSPSQFFYKADHKLDESWFIDGDAIRPWKAFQQELKINDIPITTPATVSERRRLFANTLGVEAKYMELVPRALAFKPVDDLNAFIFQFLLKEEEIDIKDLRENIREYQIFEKKLQEEKKNFDELAKINDNYLEYQRNIRTLRILDVAKQKILERKLKNEKKLLDKRIGDTNTILDTLTIERNELELKKQTDQKELYGVEKDDRLRKIASMEENLRTLQAQYKTLKIDYTDFARKIEDAEKKLRKQDLQYDFSSFLTEQFSLDDARQTLSYISKEVRMKEDECFSLLFRFAQEEKKLNADIQENERILQGLRQQRFSCPSDTKRMIDFLTTMLAEHFLESVEVRPLYDYLDIADEAWRDALEGYLDIDRFSVVVDPQYFPVATELYEHYKDKNDLHGVRLLDVRKTHKREYDSGSLAEIVECRTQYVQGYVNYLLGNVMRVQDTNSLQSYTSAITQDCIVYDKYGFRVIAPEIFKTPYVGAHALQIQLEQREKKKSELNEMLIHNRSRAVDVRHTQEELRTVDFGFLSAKLAQVDSYWEIKNRVAEEQVLFDGYRNDSEIFAKINLREKIQARINETEERISSILMKTGVLKEKVAQDEDQLRNTVAYLEEFAKNKAEFEVSNVEYLIEAEQIEEELDEEYGGDHPLMNKKLDERKTAYEREKNKLERGIENSLFRYSERTRGGYSTEITGIDQYLKRYFTLRDIDLVKAQEDVKIAREKSERTFQESFISKLAENIKTANDSIKKLNKGLKPHSFGGERYEFTIAPSKDASFGDYYRIITSGQAMVADNLFSEMLEPRDRDLMDTLFRQLSSFDDDRKNEQELRRYTDYRNYMSYDILVTNANGETMRLSKVIKEKSGGETQTPFYVTIASSFEQAVSKIHEVSSGCVVMFDEAFNNMDSGRIKAMLEFYNQLSIQVLIVVPPSRAAAIERYVHTVIFVGKQNNKGFATEVYHEEH